MSNKIITTVVITLGILIVLSFIALFYGLYLKISKNSVNISYSPDLISLNLKNDEHIVRLHIGLEDPKDLIDDLKNAMKHIK